MTILALTAEEVATNGKAWVDAIIAVMTSIIGGVGVLALAAVAVYQNIRKAIPQELNDRLDRYNKRLDNIAVATVAAAPEEKKAEVAVAVAPIPTGGEPVKPVVVPPPVISTATEPPITEPEKTEQPKPEEPKPTV